MVEHEETPREMNTESTGKREDEMAQVTDSQAYLLCRNASLDCQVDREVCVEGSAVGRYGSKKEALEALRDEWEKGDCF